MVSREKLLIAAEQCLLEMGHRLTTVKEISKKAGVNHGLVHHYFGHKEQLYVELIKFIDNRDIAPEHPLKSADEFYKYFMEVLAPKARILIEFHSMVEEMPEVSKALASMMKARRKELLSVLGHDDERIGHFILAFITGLVLNYDIDKTIPIKEIIHLLFRNSFLKVSGSSKNRSTGKTSISSQKHSSR